MFWHYFKMNKSDLSNLRIIQKLRLLQEGNKVSYNFSFLSSPQRNLKVVKHINNPAAFQITNHFSPIIPLIQYVFIFVMNTGINKR